MLSDKFGKCNTLFAVAVLLFLLFTSKAQASPDIVFDFAIERTGVASYRIVVNSFGSYPAETIAVNGIEIQVDNPVDGFTADFRSESVIVGRVGVAFGYCDEQGGLKTCSIIEQETIVQGVNYIYLPLAMGGGQ